MAPRLQRWDLHTTKPNCEPPVAPLGPFLSPLVVATVVGNSGYEPAPLDGEQEPETHLHVPVQHFEGAAVANPTRRRRWPDAPGHGGVPSARRLDLPARAGRESGDPGVHGPLTPPR